MSLSKRKVVFISLTALGTMASLYFFIMKEWLLLVIGILFSLVASYNITCEDK